MKSVEQDLRIIAASVSASVCVCATSDNCTPPTSTELGRYLFTNGCVCPTLFKDTFYWLLFCNSILNVCSLALLLFSVSVYVIPTDMCHKPERRWPMYEPLPWLMKVSINLKRLALYVCVFVCVCSTVCASSRRSCRIEAS